LQYFPLKSAKMCYLFHWLQNIYELECFCYRYCVEIVRLMKTPFLAGRLTLISKSWKQNLFTRRSTVVFCQGCLRNPIISNNETYSRISSIGRESEDLCLVSFVGVFVSTNHYFRCCLRVLRHPLSFRLLNSLFVVKHDWLRDILWASEHIPLSNSYSLSLVTEIPKSSCVGRIVWGNISVHLFKVKRTDSPSFDLNRLSQCCSKKYIVSRGRERKRFHSPIEITPNNRVERKQ
jgi:hypothetical protein